MCNKPWCTCEDPSYWQERYDELLAGRSHLLLRFMYAVMKDSADGSDETPESFVANFLKREG